MNKLLFTVSGIYKVISWYILCVIFRADIFHLYSNNDVIVFQTYQSKKHHKKFL